ncbi:MAG: LptF/LptG family permease, partial [Candidatus Aerophobetes bacterium]|nr:LptF/LptG family permease [Candidatus Aerophobetes bacterium]
MKIIHRYILKEIMSSFVLGFLFFNFILFIAAIFELMELIFVENIPALEVGKLVLFKTPAFFDIVIPVSVLFSALLTFGRLSSDGEITALRSSGVSLLQVGTPLLALALALTATSLYFSAYLTPLCNHYYKETYRQILLERPTLQIKEKTITDLKGKKLYTYHLNPENYEMEGILIYEFPPEGAHKFPQLTLAKKGKFIGKILQLKDVTLYRIGENYRIIQRGTFNSQNIYLETQ